MKRVRKSEAAFPWVRIASSVLDLAKDTLKSKELLAESSTLEAMRTQDKLISALIAKGFYLHRLQLNMALKISSSSENQPRRNEENEERTEKNRCESVSSWLFFIFSGRREAT